MEDMIYSLIDAGITKAKLYVIKAKNEAMDQLAEKQPILKDIIWSKIQSFLALFQHPPEIEQLCNEFLLASKSIFSKNYCSNIFGITV